VTGSRVDACVGAAIAGPPKSWLLAGIFSSQLALYRMENRLLAIVRFHGSFRPTPPHVITNHTAVVPSMPVSKEPMMSMTV
jgi:hypothetical protein